ncbi:hypothetical protein Rhe02_37810 [Rhizocola hellebori]|uniref:Uncharacterized protein n=1 Tax=Rhizocola hellebori TaxID=1392758 RepID=A0A8J3Q7Z6_9ACTN|nr:hypothetical protein Rhe02_37810 [Rhizocola hellebori]
MNFIDHNRDRFGGVEPICRVLTEYGCPIAASTYYNAKTLPPSVRDVRDSIVLQHIQRVHTVNSGVHAAREIWHPLRREGVQVARVPCGRLMRPPRAGWPMLGEARRSAPPLPIRLTTEPVTCCSAISPPRGRISGGSPISPTCPRGQGWHSSTWPPPNGPTGGTTIAGCTRPSGTYPSRMRIDVLRSTHPDQAMLVTT